MKTIQYNTIQASDETHADGELRNSHKERKCGETQICTQEAHSRFTLVRVGAVMFWSSHVLRRYIQLRLSQRGHRAERGTHTHERANHELLARAQRKQKYDTATGESNICARDTVLTLECRLGGCKRRRASRHERPVVWYGTLRFLSLRCRSCVDLVVKASTPSQFWA